MEALKSWRSKQSGVTDVPQKIMKYDLVIVGGGIAGCAASIAAAEQGLKVALVHDRPVLGGNASGEIRVHTLGIYGKFERILKMLDTEHYPNGSAEALKEDQKRMTNIAKYKNIDAFLNFRAYHATTEKGKISSVDARHTSTGEMLRFEAPLFVDCTGDGWIGYWAGADYNYGREASSKYNEAWDAQGLLWSPETPDNFVMGSSVLWGSENAGKPVVFPEVPWAMDVAGTYAEKNGEWQWEFSQNDLSQIEDAETIRDHMFRAIYGSFCNYKHPSTQRKNSDQGVYGTFDNTIQQQKADSLQLKWVSYLLGKRESRRLVGDYLDQRQLDKYFSAYQKFEIPGYQELLKKNNLKKTNKRLE
ncbi:MAG: FAD-dependent oxidoreductase [Bacteroidota bacterium]|nr:FAD-dependent oxidoreductase [Bacteroidota bacterium]